MIERSEVERAIGTARSKAERIVFLGALLERATGNETIVVGGSAIEVLTAGQTSSADIDIVTPRHPAVEVLLAWGFVPAGRVFRRDDWNLDVDLVGGKLTGDRTKVRRIETPFGSVDIIGPEDLIVKRLAELKHGHPTPRWQKDLIQQISLLMSEYSEGLDEAYLAFIARRDDVVDILHDFRRHAEAEQNRVA